MKSSNRFVDCEGNSIEEGDIVLFVGIVTTHTWMGIVKDTYWDSLEEKMAIVVEWTLSDGRSSITHVYAAQSVQLVKNPDEIALFVLARLGT